MKKRITCHFEKPREVFIFRKSCKPYENKVQHFWGPDWSLHLANSVANPPVIFPFDH